MSYRTDDERKLLSDFIKFLSEEQWVIPSTVPALLGGLSAFIQQRINNLNTGLLHDLNDQH